jgi:2OG-Fe(II) oxygenase superfamily
MIQLTRSGTVVSASASEVENLRAEFGRQHCIQFSGLLEAGLVDFIQSEVDHAEFYPKIHKSIGVELSTAHHVLLPLLHILINDQKLFEIVHQITGCGRIGCFTGRIYRMMPRSDHYDSWHNDMVEDRVVAMSINLSSEIYSGGILQIRDKYSQRIVHEVANLGFGDGIIFRLARSLEHRLTNVKGAVPKTAFAGWFKSQPDFLSVLKNAPSELR